MYVQLYVVYSVGKYCISLFETFCWWFDFAHLLNLC